MHWTSIYLHSGWWYGRCNCNWMSGAYRTEDGAVGACITHVEAQNN